ncbi:GTPase IMAP family member 8-like isoform X1 [Anguilla anguilla]|uniref:GTPase IMAP family member 8-like isoform X1 n=1 Tax=Anguilla anguilla TaxID=7936 RepID=UPI0015AAB5FE|nr:GTPase IMAP family member 8-like isoform X1 [Anguilla anguilla]
MNHEIQYRSFVHLFPEVQKPTVKEEMAAHRLNSQQGEVWSQPQLSLVLLGERLSGKSSVGNVLLGRRQFEAGEVTSHSRKGTGMVAGRQVTVVDTPGWYVERRTPESVHQEIELGVALCPTVPRVFLLVLCITKEFGLAEWRAMCTHLGLLQFPVWTHSVVLFNPGDQLGAQSIEENIKGGGQYLQRLMEMCGNRYCVLGRDGQALIAQLLEEMEPLAEGRRSNTTQIQQKREGAEWKRREEGERFLVWMEKQTQKPTALHMAELDHGSALTLVLLGRRLAGKSSAGNTILGGRQFESGKKTVCCAEKWGTVAWRRITVADTPGWSQYGLANREQVRAEIMRSASLHPHGPRAFLLTIPVDSFTERNRRAVEEHLGLLGECVWRRTLVLFTWGDKLNGRSIGQHIKKMGVALSGLVEKCGNRYHVFNNINRANDTQVIELLEMVDRM